MNGAREREAGRMDVGRVAVGCGLWGGVLLFKEVCLHKREEMGNKRL